jgi:hypothetical protein
MTFASQALFCTLARARAALAASAAAAAFTASMFIAVFGTRLLACKRKESMPLPPLYSSPENPCMNVFGWKVRMVGNDLIPCFLQIGSPAPMQSTSAISKSAEPSNSSAKTSQVGLIALQWSHQGAKNFTNTLRLPTASCQFSGVSSIVASTLASVSNIAETRTILCEESTAAHVQQVID